MVDRPCISTLAASAQFTLDRRPQRRRHTLRDSLDTSPATTGLTMRLMMRQIIVHRAPATPQNLHLHGMSALAMSLTVQKPLDLPTAIPAPTTTGQLTLNRRPQRRRHTLRDSLDTSPATTGLTMRLMMRQIIVHRAPATPQNLHLHGMSALAMSLTVQKPLDLPTAIPAPTTTGQLTLNRRPQRRRHTLRDSLDTSPATTGLTMRLMMRQFIVHRPSASHLRLRERS
ncbi:hypothetical protein ACQPZA_09395 [Pseudonocardia xinjiangensis]|uniref:hypothetical protein n=1 Tax=Pseudonocardia xinjiangensis TaxID=75289 RepID=UPI003D8C2A43